jgi:hypothetical protein
MVLVAARAPVRVPAALEQVLARRPVEQALARVRRLAVLARALVLRRLPVLAQVPALRPLRALASEPAHRLQLAWVPARERLLPPAQAPVLEHRPQTVRGHRLAPQRLTVSARERARHRAQLQAKAAAATFEPHRRAKTERRARLAELAVDRAAVKAVARVVAATAAVRTAPSRGRIREAAADRSALAEPRKRRTNVVPRSIVG